jgi:hypothetical protein
MLAGLLAAGLVAGVSDAAPKGSQWTTTFVLQCNGMPSDHYIRAYGNLLNKQGSAMTIDGSDTSTLFNLPCWTNSPDTWTYTHTTKHQPVEAVLNWDVVYIYGSNPSPNPCSPVSTVPAVPGSSGTHCGAYGSANVTITTGK